MVKPVATPKIAFIGAGNMAYSLLKGLLQKNYPSQQLAVAAPDAVRIDALREELGIAGDTDNCQVIQHADIVVLAVKPQQLSTVCHEIAARVASQHSLLISVAAGASVDFFTTIFGEKTPIVRCMPNTPALIGQGAAGLFANALVTEKQKIWAEDILNAVGKSIWVKEEQQIDIITALSGSGPAYFFYFMETLQQAAEKLGLPHDTARDLTLQTAIGAASLALHSRDDLTTLRKNVTSPGGTTEQGIHVLQQGDLALLCEKTLQAAQQRATELAQQLLQRETSQ